MEIFCEILAALPDIVGKLWVFIVAVAACLGAVAFNERRRV